MFHSFYKVLRCSTLAGGCNFTFCKQSSGALFSLLPTSLFASSVEIKGEQFLTKLLFEDEGGSSMKEMQFFALVVF